MEKILIFLIVYERAKLVKEIAKIAGADTAKEVNQSFPTIH